MKQFSSLLEEVISLLKAGSVGVIPTDTVYGVVALLSDETAVRRIYSVKGHGDNRAVGTILIGDTQQLETVTSPGLVATAAQHWPGAVSVILPVGDRYKYAHRGLNSLAFRLPAAEELRDFLLSTGPLATSSANKSGMPVATTIEEAVQYFGDSVDFYVDGGDLSGRVASKIIKITEAGDQIIRS